MQKTSLVGQIEKLKKKRRLYHLLVIHFGGVEETRTLAPVTRSTSLAGKPLHQLGYYSR